MKLLMTGKAVEVTPTEYTNRENQLVRTFDAYIASDNPRYAATRLSGPADLICKAGENVTYEVRAQARKRANGDTYVTYWAVARS